MSTIPSLTFSIMYVSWLKVPLLLTSAYCTHISVKPPNPPASHEEQTRYIKDNHIRDAVTFSGLWRAKAFRYTLYSITLTEAFLITASVIVTLPPVPEIFQPSYSLDVQRLRLSNVYFLGLCFMCVGASIRAACYRHLGRLFTFELSVKKGHQLITTGPYSFVRHPSYIGSCFFYVGACFSQLGSGSLLAESGLWDTLAGRIFALVYVGYSLYVCSFLLARISKEDLVMRQEFGDQWVAWAKRTPYRLVPYVY